MTKRIKRLAQTLAVLVIIGAVGCGIGNKPTVRVSIPFDPQQSSITGLKGQVKVSGMSGVFQMVFSGSTASVTIDKVPEGSRTFTITFFTGANPGDGTIVAEVTVTRNVDADADLSITYGATDFNYDFDDDDDGFVNYDELIAGSDPDDATDYPAAVLSADAGLDQTAVPGAEVTLYGDNSEICVGAECIYLVDYPYDSDVTITWEWSFTTNIPSSTMAYLYDNDLPVARFTPDVTGTYEIKLVVSFCVMSDCISDDDYVNVTASTTGGAGTPPAPTGLTANQVAGPAVSLSWTDNSTNETGFKLEWSMDQASWYALTDVAVNVVQYTDTDVLAGNTYYYRVCAANASGNSVYSNVAQITLTSGTASSWTAGFLGAGGYHACATTVAGAVKCWGDNFYGQLGNGSSTGPQTCNDGTNNVACSTIPVDVSTLTGGGIAKVAVGGYHTCALTAGLTGGVKCWGYNSWGELGNSSNIDALAPVNVTGLTTGVTDISAGLYHTCALISDGTVNCWGDDTYGQMGNGVTSATYNSPQAVESGLQTLTGVTAISAGRFHTCAIVTGGAVKCWGRNNYGQLGNGTLLDSSVPVSVSGITSGATSLSASNNGSFTCAVVSGGVKCWGNNYYNQLGVFNSSGPQWCDFEACSMTPVNVTGLTTGAVSVSAGATHACALTTAGGVKCWGNGEDGSLGNGSLANIYAPADVTGLTGAVSQISLGGFFSCARLSAGTLQCWGNNYYGQAGDGTSGTSAQKNTPVDVSM